MTEQKTQELLWNDKDDLDTMTNKFNQAVEQNVTGLQGFNEFKQSLNKETVGLDKVDNTSDEEKPVSTEQQKAINDAIQGMATLEDIALLPRVYDTLEALKADSTVTDGLIAITLGTTIRGDSESIVYKVSTDQRDESIQMTPEGLYANVLYGGFRDTSRSTASLASYAEYHAWEHGITDDSRIGLVVTANQVGIAEATPEDVPIGVTVNNAAFIGNYSEENAADTGKVLIAFIGTVTVQDDGTCVNGGLATIDPQNSGKMTASEDSGFRVVGRLDSTHVNIVLNVGAGVSGNDDKGKILPIEKGGTGAETAEAARTNLNVLSKDESVSKTDLAKKQDALTLPLPVSQGGTGADNPDDARTNLGIVNAAPVFTGTCETAADVAAKVVTCSEFEEWHLSSGTIISIRFTFENSNKTPTININDTGAKQILLNGKENVTWETGVDVILRYINGHWECINGAVQELIDKLTDFESVSWDQINKFVPKVIAKPQDYTDLLHKTKTVRLEAPISKEIEFEIVDICHTDWGSNHAFVWLPKEECLQAMAHQPSAATNKTYRDSQIRTALLSGGSIFNAFPADLKAVWKDINYKYLTTATSSSWSASGSPTTETAKLVLPSIVEVGLVGSTSSGQANYAKEGTVFQAFAAAENAERIRKGSGSPVVWWLRSLYYWGSNYSYFAFVGSSGSLGYNDGYGTGYWVCPCFVV